MFEKLLLAVKVIMIALIHWLVYKANVLVHVGVCYVAKMLIVNQKVMLLGVDVAWALQKMKMVNVFRVSIQMEYTNKLKF